MVRLTALAYSVGLLALAAASASWAQSETNGAGSAQPIAPPGADTHAPSAPAEAAMPSPTASTGVSTAGNVQEVVVTARKIKENIQTVPVAITALSGNALAQASVRQVNDLQQLVPNLFLQQSANDPQALYVTIRGQKQNDLPLTVDPTVGIYVDGVYNPRTYGLAGALVDMDRVEVLRGPQGTLYGRNTTGGAVSLFSKNPTDHYGASVDVTAGDYGAWNVVGIANLPLGEGWALRLVYQRGEHDGYGKDGLGRPLDDEDSTYMRAKLKGEIGPYVEAVLGATYQQNDTGGELVKLSGLSQPGGGLPAGGAATLQTALQTGLGLSPAGLASAATLLNSYAGGDFYRSGATDPQYANFHESTVDLDIKVKLPLDLTLRSITGYQDLGRSNQLDLDGTPIELISAYLGTYDTYYSQEFQLLGGDKRLNYVAGVYGGRENGLELGSSNVLPFLVTTNPTDYNAGVHNTSLAVYGQANWEFIPTYRLTAGLRYSGDSRTIYPFSTDAQGCIVPAAGVEVTPPGASDCTRKFHKTFSDPSWLISLDHQVSREVFAYVKVSHGYRTGGWNYRGANISESFNYFAPETVTEYEGGIKSELFERRLRLNLAGYHDDYSNIQRSVSIGTATGAPATVVANAAQGEINGFEGESFLRVNDNLSVGASAGLTDAFYDKYADLTGNHVNEDFGVPKWTAGANFRYVQPTQLGNAALQMDYHWQSAVDLFPGTPTQSQVTQNSYAIVNGRLSLALNRWNADVALYVKNLAQQHYFAAALSLENSLGINYRIPGQPRTFGVEIIKRFGDI